MTDPAERTGPGDLVSLANIGADELIAEIVHQFRSRFTSILVLAEMLYQAPERFDPEELRRHAGLLYGSAFAGSVVASDLMALARADDHARHGGMEPFSVSELFDSVAADFAPIAGVRGLDIRVRSLEKHERSGHPMLMRRILLDLAFVVLELGNDGNLDLSADASRGDHIDFTVGGSTERLDDATVREFDQPFEPRDSGNGCYWSPIGLAVVCARDAIARLGGDLSVDADSQHGLYFRFALELPVSAASSD